MLSKAFKNKAVLAHLNRQIGTRAKASIFHRMINVPDKGSAAATMAS